MPGCIGGVLPTACEVIGISLRQAGFVAIVTAFFSHEHAVASLVCCEEVHRSLVLHGPLVHGSDLTLEGSQVFMTFLSGSDTSLISTTENPMVPSLKIVAI